MKLVILTSFAVLFLSIGLPSSGFSTENTLERHSIREHGNGPPDEPWGFWVCVIGLFAARVLMSGAGGNTRSIGKEPQEFDGSMK